MFNRTLVLFLSVVGCMILGVVWFIQSTQFAGLLKMGLARYLPKEIGIETDFSEFTVKFYPPGFSVRSPKILVKKGGKTGLPDGSSLTASSVEFTFRPLQILSGNIRVHEVNVIDGKLEVNIGAIQPAPAKKRSRLEFHWDELLNVHTESLRLGNMDILLTSGNKTPVSFHVGSIIVAQASAKGGLGYELTLDVDHLSGDPLSFAGVDQAPALSLKYLKLNAYLNALGLRIDTVSLGDAEWGISGSGNIIGNILEPKDLKAELNVNVGGDLEKLLRSVPQLNKGEVPKGLVSFNGSLHGNPMKVLQTLKAEGVLSVRNFAFQKWAADHVEVAGEYEGGSVTLRHALIQSQPKPRVGGNQPGSGGEIEIGATKWTIGSLNPFSVPLKFKDAHLHWMGAPAVKQLYPLDFVLSGSIQAKVTPPGTKQKWAIDAELNADVDHFLLDNQRLGQKKPQRALFKVPKLSLSGGIRLDAEGVHPENFQARMPNTTLSVSGGIDFDTGYDLAVTGPMDLSDLGQISEVDVQGAGQISARIHGPSSAVLVEVDLDAKDVGYLHLNLGNAKGRITWDDDLNHLLFTKMKLEKNVTNYDLNGVLKFDKQDTVDLEARITQGDIQDFIQVFKYLTTSLSWFPASLNGAFSGSLKVSGGIDLKELRVLAQLNGTNWEYFGERFKSIYFAGGYDRGKYFVENAVGLKRFGRVKGGISYSPDGVLDWKLKTDGFTLADFDFMNEVDVPIRGKLEISTSGKGAIGKISSSSRIDLDHFAVKGALLPSSHFSFESSGGTARLSAQALGGQGNIEGAYDFNPKNLSHVHAELKQLDFSPVLMVLNSKGNIDDRLQGLISGMLDLKFHSGSSEQGVGRISLSEYSLQHAGSRFSLMRPVTFEVSQGNFEIPDLSLVGKSKVARMQLQGSAGKLNGVISGSLDTSILEFFTSAITQAKGQVGLDFRIAGSMKEPTLTGQAKVSDGSFRLDSLDALLENVNGVVNLNQNLLTFKKFDADVGGGKIQADGTITVFADRYPALNLKAYLDGPKVKIYPFQFVKVGGNLLVIGDGLPYKIEGKLAVSSALSKEKVLTRKQSGQGLKAAQYAPSQSRSTEGSLSRFALNVHVDAADGVMVQNDLFRDVELKCKLVLVNTLEAPRVVGLVEALKGKLMFKEHAFQIQSAKAKFDNPTIVDPTLDLSATAEVNRTKIQMFASGKQDKLRVDLTSSPSMAPSEIISLLTVGLTSTDAKRLNATDLNAIQQGEAASLVLHSLDFNRDLEDKTGFQVKVDESVNPTQGVSAFRAQGDTSTAAAPQITIRRKLGDRLELSAGTTVGVGTNRANQVNLDFLVNKDVSITGVYNNYGAAGSSDSQVFQSSGGLDLKFQKRFK